jgi:hypothetical protein
LYYINNTGGTGTYVTAGLRASGSAPRTVVNSATAVAGYGYHGDFVNGSTMTANCFSVHEFYIQNYVNSLSLNRTIAVTGGQAGAVTARRIGVQTTKYQGTTAITSISFLPVTGSWDTGSTFDLYGISNA